MTCIHLKDFKRDHGLKSYETIHGFFVLSPNISKTFHQVFISCFDCEAFCNNRLLACLQCVYFGCFKKHAEYHSNCNDHYLYVELSNGHVYCYKCSDYIHDSDVEEISEKHRSNVFRVGDNVGWSSCPAFNGPTRYVPWRPTVADSKILQQHSVRLKVEPSSTVGIRVLVNLGSTCFMNCIMQAFFHTPMLRDYFFMDRHRCHSRKTKDCLFCLFARVFQKYYADDKSTLSLHEILYFVWQNDPILSGYEQKDAHEYLISVLNLLHQHSSDSHSTLSINNSNIVDLIFHGKMQSDVVCQACANVSTKIDPFSDISLDITNAELTQCLYHFTRAEVLGSSAKIRCSTCQSYQESTKQLTFRLLPVVIVIHLKRFERVNTKCKKKTLYVSFPMELDMSPYTSNLRNQSHLKNSTNLDNRYTLYAVAVHMGASLDIGHYVAYIRRTKHTWFKCTDVEVVPADTSEVMASEGYLLFYHKTVLFYK